MKAEYFSEAVEIITQSNSPKVSFRVPVKDNYQNIHDILIHNSNASLINKLVDAGFLLSMCDKGLIVDKY
jgi:hypothetical protein